MANLFDSKTNILLTTIGLTILVVAAVFLLPRKSAVVQAAAPLVAETPAVVQPEVETKDYFQEATERREQMLAAKEEAEVLEKRRIAKEKTVECRFWKQQQTLGQSDKTDAKVLEHCTLDYVAPEADVLEGVQQETN